jgi:hypothetical protein
MTSFQDRGPAEELNASIGEAGRHHSDGAILIEAEEDAGGEKNLCAAEIRAQHKAVRDFRKSAKALLKLFISQEDLPFEEVDEAGVSGTDGLSCQEHSEQRKH